MLGLLASEGCGAWTYDEGGVSVMCWAVVRGCGVVDLWRAVDEDAVL